MMGKFSIICLKTVTVFKFQDICKCYQHPHISYLNASGIFIGGIPNVSDGAYIADTGKVHVSAEATGTENETVYSIWDVCNTDQEINFFFDMGFDGTDSGYAFSATHMGAGHYADKRYDNAFQLGF